MKISQHTIQVVACATLLLVTVLAPAQANARDNDSRGTRYAQSDSAVKNQNSEKQKSQRSSRSRDTQGSAAANTPNNKEDKRTPRNSDSQKEAPAVSRSEAAAIAERATGGRVLSVKQSGRYWQVKVLVDDKRVHFVSVDMRSGAVR